MTYFLSRLRRASGRALPLPRSLRAAGGKACELYTYSASTGVRVALLAAGFYVAQGLRPTVSRTRPWR